MREFQSGAIRDTDEGKNDYDGFLSPLFIEAFGNYMTKHRQMPDGNLRASDNWQKGFGPGVGMKSLWRHFLDLWMITRGHKRLDPKDGHEITLLEACCACFFNLQLIAHEKLQSDEDFKDYAIDLTAALRRAAENPYNDYDGDGSEVDTAHQNYEGPRL